MAAMIKSFFTMTLLSATLSRLTLYKSTLNGTLVGVLIIGLSNRIISFSAVSIKRSN